MSNKNRNLVYGVGINDYDGNISVHGKHMKSYKCWLRVLERCYDTTYKTKNPTYKDVVICDEWIRFTAFKEWFDVNYVEGYEIDKDILVQGNKVYSPDTCCFVPRRINTLLLNKQRTNTNGFIGVYRNSDNIYKAFMQMDGKQKHIGYFNTAEEASAAYIKAKTKYATEVVTEYFNNGMIDEKVRDAIINRDWTR